MSTGDRLIHMANQIASNFARMGEVGAAEATADHMLSFWDPLMKQRIGALAIDRPGQFSPAAALAIVRLQAGPVAPQTPATEFNAGDQAGHCDAG